MTALGKLPLNLLQSLKPIRKKRVVAMGVVGCIEVILPVADTN